MWVHISRTSVHIGYESVLIGAYPVNLASIVFLVYFRCLYLYFSNRRKLSATENDGEI